MKRKVILFAIFLLTFQFFVQFYLARTDSQTTDEAIHLSAGYTYLAKKDFRFNPEHPPLVKLLAATPLLFVNPLLPKDNYLWDRGSNFFYDTWREAASFGEFFLYKENNADQILFLGRLPMIFLTLILGVSIFIIANRIWGPYAGIISLIFYVFDPNITAHGHLITTDIAISLGYLWSIYLFWQYLNKQTWRNLILFALAFSFSQLVKFTAVILVPVLLILLAIFAYQNKWQVKKTLRMFPYLIIVLIINWLIIWGCFGFKTTLAPKTDSILAEIKTSNLESQTTFSDEINKSESESTSQVSPDTAADKFYSKARYFLIPRDYFKGLVMLLTHVGGGHNSFFLGMSSNKGWWYYFPVLFILKTPIPTLIAAALSIYFFVFSKKRKKDISFMALAALLFLIFSMLSRANLGIRHIFPVYPLIFIMIGGLATLKWNKKILIILASWLFIEFLVVSPFFLSYYNEFAGGTKNGYKIATDSNLDWGQDLKRIKKYLDNKKLSDVYVEYLWGGKSSLDFYGIKTLPLEILNPDSNGYLIIGSSALNSTKYEWLKNQKVYDRITPSVFVYKLN